MKGRRFIVVGVGFSSAESSFRPMIYPATLSTMFTFGKHKGEMMESVIVDDPSYINWCLENVERFSLDEDCQNLFSMQDWDDYANPDFDDEYPEWGFQK